MSDKITTLHTVFSLMAFYDIDSDDGDTLYEIQPGWGNEKEMHIPRIGEHVFLSSYENNYVSDYKKPIFRNRYEVVDVISSYSENKGDKTVTVQYHIYLKKK